jgi:hypothetical protein
MKTENLKSQLEKISQLLNYSNGSLQKKNQISTIAKTPEKFGYTLEKIITALEIGILLAKGGKVRTVKIPASGGTKGTATFFNNYVLPMYPNAMIAN